MPPVAHWDDVDPERRERGHIAGSWRDLGTVAGSVSVGVQRIEVEPGRWSTPLHVEGSEEEIFFVLAGSGISLEWDGESTVAYPIRAGDCVVYPALEVAHTTRAGPEGLDLLAFGMRSYADAATYLPRAGVAWLGPTWVLVGGEENHPWTREAAAGEPEVGELMERPSTIVNVVEIDGDERAGETVARVRRNLGRAARSLRTGMQHVVVAPGKLAVPPHCHSAEEEIFVVLDGEGALILGTEEHRVRRGSIVARPAATGVAHTFRAGDERLTLLAYGTREPNDITYYPRSNKISFRGVGVVARLEKLDYWDGED
ncbi:MAG: cupin domain-containing protein [Actinomycetota bacterium]|nr:cupin domain-containing protein [Actinomycetota bacterium]